jgi:hypothetical protein
MRGSGALRSGTLSERKAWSRARFRISISSGPNLLPASNRLIGIATHQLPSRETCRQTLRRVRLCSNACPWKSASAWHNSPTCLGIPFAEVRHCPALVSTDSYGIKTDGNPMPDEPASWNVFLNEKFQLLRPAGLPSFMAAGPCCSPEPKHRHANLEPQGQG